MSILTQYLEKYLHKLVIIVMDDGVAYLGKLREFDDQVMVLEHVKEAEYKKAPIWEEPRIKIPSPNMLAMRGKDKEMLSGFVDRRVVGKTLSTVIVNISHVLRIWGDDFLER